ncbi:MAG: lipopolysaccharide kinase InaA family protein, partial [Candidatus Binataceae bacterium]
SFVDMKGDPPRFRHGLFAMRISVNSKLRRDPAPVFARFAFGRSGLIYLRRDIGMHATAIVARLYDWRAGREPGLGNRQSAFRVKLNGAPELFARCARRGGMMGAVVTDLFFGFNPRPLHELEIASEAHHRGIPIAEPMGAMVEWIAPAVYRGFFLTRAVNGMSLWDFIRTDDDPIVRHHVMEQARAAIEAMHQGGLFHADLNLHNLLVTQKGESFAVVILDLDKARIFNRALPPSMRRRNRMRVIRSARKLDPYKKYFDSRLLELLKVE